MFRLFSRRIYTCFDKYLLTSNILKTYFPNQLTLYEVGSDRYPGSAQAYIRGARRRACNMLARVGGSYKGPQGKFFHADHKMIRSLSLFVLVLKCVASTMDWAFLIQLFSITQSLSYFYFKHLMILKTQDVTHLTRCWKPIILGNS